MRIVPCLLSVAVTVSLVLVMNTQLPVGGGKTPRLGYFLSPQKGFWQNAEPADLVYDDIVHSPELQGDAEVIFDDRLVPHVYADNEHDVYFIQGYLLSLIHISEPTRPY